MEINENETEKVCCRRYPLCRWQRHTCSDDMGRVQSTYVLLSMRGIPHVLFRVLDGIGSGGVALRIACDLDDHDTKMLYEEAIRIERDRLDLP